MVWDCGIRYDQYESIDKNGKIATEGLIRRYTLAE